MQKHASYSQYPKIPIFKPCFSLFRSVQLLEQQRNFSDGQHKLHCATSLQPNHKQPQHKQSMSPKWSKRK